MSLAEEIKSKKDDMKAFYAEKGDELRSGLLSTLHTLMFNASLEAIHREKSSIAASGKAKVRIPIPSGGWIGALLAAAEIEPLDEMVKASPFGSMVSFIEFWGNEDKNAGNALGQEMVRNLAAKLSTETGLVVSSDGAMSHFHVAMA